jgi:hypothetical protein
VARRAIGSIRWFDRRRRAQPAWLTRRPVRTTVCGRANALVERPVLPAFCAGKIGPSRTGWLGLQVGSRQLFEKLDIFSQQLINHLADILAFPTGNALEFTL